MQVFSQSSTRLPDRKEKPVTIDVASENGTE